MVSKVAEGMRAADKAHRNEEHRKTLSGADARAATEIEDNTVTLSDGSRVYVPGSYSVRRKPGFIAQVEKQRG